MQEKKDLSQESYIAKYLFNDNRSKDLERASKDIEYQKKLLKEYGIE